METKRSINGFPIFTQSLWNTEGASLHSEEFIFRRDSMSTCLFSALGRYSAVTVTFFLIAVRKFVLKDKHFQILSQGRYEYAVTLFPVLSKRFPEPVLMQEVQVRLCASFSPAESTSLQFSFLFRLRPDL